jgi:phosphoglycolate phosphatase
MAANKATTGQWQGTPATQAGCVIFDLDGTLVDTAPDLLNTLNVLFGRLGRRPIQLPEIRGIIGRGARSMIRKGAELTGGPFPETEVESLFQEYLVHYGRTLADSSRPYPGAREVLDALQARNIPMGICTNKLEGLSLALLGALDLRRYFASVIGADTLHVMKPDPETVHAILRPVGVPPERTLFVGDSETDLKTARAAGTKIVLVDYGYSQTPAGELAADRLISSLKDLLEDTPAPSGA